MSALFFGPYKPDQTDLNNENSTVLNVLPKLRGYAPLRSLQPPLSSALDSAPLGARVARLAAGTFAIYVGTATKLYKYDASTQGWTDVSRAVGGDYAATDSAPWVFRQYGTDLVAVNPNDEPQYINVDSGTNFDALSGSPPQAGTMDVVGDFLVLGALTSNTRVIHWSAINDISGWTAGTDSSDTQEFPDGGEVRAIAGGDAGYVFQAAAIRRMIFTPGGEPNYVFRFEKVSDERGAVSGRGVVAVGPRVYFLAQDGFFVIGPEGMKNIGWETINDTFVKNIDQAEMVNVQGCADPVHSRVYWIYRSNDAATTYPNKMLIYDYAVDRWATANFDQYVIFPAAAAAFSLEDLDNVSSSIETLQFSFDSSVWSGGAPALASFGSDLKLSFFAGDNLEATLTTGEIEPNPGFRTFCSKVRPLTDARAPTNSNATSYAPLVSISYRPTLQVNPTVSAASLQEEDGSCSQRVESRYMKYRLTIPAGAEWTYAVGVDPEVRRAGAR